MLNWTILSAANFVCMLLGYSLLAYAVARLTWRGRGLFFVLVAIFICANLWLVTQLVATLALEWPHLRYLIWFGDWLSCAFSIVLLWHTLKDVPPNRADAARIDGCGFVRVYWHVLLPLVRPMMWIIALLTLFASVPDLLAEGLENLQGRATFITTSLPAMAGASAIMALPLFVIFFLARKLFPPAKP